MRQFVGGFVTVNPERTGRWDADEWARFLRQLPDGLEYLVVNNRTDRETFAACLECIRVESVLDLYVDFDCDPTIALEMDHQHHYHGWYVNESAGQVDIAKIKKLCSLLPSKPTLIAPYWPSDQWFPAARELRQLPCDTVAAQDGVAVHRRDPRLWTCSWKALRNDVIGCGDRAAAVIECFDEVDYLAPTTIDRLRRQIDAVPDNVPLICFDLQHLHDTSLGDAYREEMA